jgi:hypothetical protein
VSVNKTVQAWRKRNGMKPVKIVIPPYLASTKAYDALILKTFAESVPQASGPGQAAMGILTLHGLPPANAKTDSWSKRVAVIKARLEPQVAAILRAKGYAKVEAQTAFEGFADPIEDPDNELVSVHELYLRAQQEGMAVAAAVPLEFMAENTDNLFAHSAIMFEGFPGYRTYQGPPANVDWSKPFVRRYRFGKTEIIYGGSPGSATIPRQSAALADAVSTLFR